STVARQMTPRTRLPPVRAYRTDSAWPCSSGVSARSPRYSSTSARSCSGFRTPPPPHLPALHPPLVCLAQLRELRQHLERLVRLVGLRQPLQFGARPFQALQEFLRTCQCVLGAQLTRSLTIRPRMPFTRRAASSVAYLFARLTASSIATSLGT